jgi:hypothetical protein
MLFEMGEWVVEPAFLICVTAFHTPGGVFHRVSGFFFLNDEVGVFN